MVSRLLRYLLVCAFALVAAPILSAQDGITAELDRNEVPAGNGALLKVTILGDRSSRPQIPAVDKLVVQLRNQAQQLQMFNGNTTVSLVFTYVVGSQTPGDYEVPAISTTIGGKKFSSQPLKLKVLPSGAPQPPAAGQNANPPQPVDEATRFGFLTVELANKTRKHLYVGEIAPVVIRAWIPVDAQGRLGGIQPSADAFTLHNVGDQPQRTEQIKDGKRYTVFIWQGGISATKAGTYPVSLSLTATLAVPDPNAPQQADDDPFGDPFFNGMFNRVPRIQKDVTLKSGDQDIEVRALPQEGKPEGFGGAIGRFKFDQYKIPSSLKTGEPSQINVRIIGSGNFALVDEPKLTPSGDWKTYPGKSEFTPGDQASFSGSKQFQFNAVPRKGGERQVGLKFSYFDPEIAAYQTLVTPPQKIAVQGADMREEKPLNDEPPAPKKEPVAQDGGLAGLHRTRQPAGSLTPLVERPAFIAMTGAGGAMLVLAQLLTVVRARRSDPKRLSRVAADKETRLALAQAHRAASTRDADAFLDAARRAVQHKLGLLWQRPGHSITTAEIEARFPADSSVALLFHLVDRHAYSPQRGEGDFAAWQRLLDAALADLERMPS